MGVAHSFSIKNIFYEKLDLYGENVMWNEMKMYGVARGSYGNEAY